MREYDLLLGILANQLHLVSHGVLVHFAQHHGENQDASLLDFLSETKALSEADQLLLCRIIDTLIHAHHGDGKAAIRTFGGDEAVSATFTGSAALSDTGWTPSEDQTVLADRLPHGLPVQIAPEAIGRYTRGSEYARGGIGRILLVHDEQIGRDVILKELLPEHLVSPTDSTLSKMPKGDSPRSPMRQSATMLARFLQEAKVTGQLEHPSIVPVYELGTRKDGQLYYTMKLVRGDTLSAAIKNCKTPGDRLALLRYFLDVCQAMAYAHSKGVIHRDLKPSNIMVGEFGECVVLDWGLAKMQKDVDAHREALEKTISQLKLGEEEQAAFKTRSKDVLGTPLYMAPEQARGEVDGVGPHSDVYSLGVVLYEILSGELPHAWTNSMDTIRRVGGNPAPRIKSVAPQTPPELAAICDKALSFVAKDRYGTAKELASDVQRFLEGAVVDAYAYKVTDILGRLYRRHKALILTVCIAAAAIVVTGAVSYVKILREKEKAVASEQVALQERDNANTQQKIAEAAQKSADAARGEAEQSLQRALRQQYLAQTRLAQSQIADQKMRLANEALAQAPESERDWVWRYLHDQANPGVYSIRSEKSKIFLAQYDPSGKYIVALRKPETPGLWKADDGEFIRSFEGDEAEYCQTAFSADGSRFAAIGRGGVLDVWEISSGKRLHHSAQPSTGLSVAFVRNGSAIWAGYEGGSLLEWDIDAGTLGRTFETGGRTIGKMCSTPDGKCVLSVYQDGGEKDAVTAWDSASGKAIYTLDGVDLWLAPGGASFLCATERALSEKKKVNSEGNSKSGYRLSMHDTATGKQVMDYDGHDAVILDVSFNESGDRFASTASDGSLRLWSVHGPSPDKELTSEIPMINVYFTSESNEIIGCRGDNRYDVFDTTTGTRLLEFAGENGHLNQAYLSRDRRRVLSSSAFNSFEVADAHRPRGYGDVAYSVERAGQYLLNISDFVVAHDEASAVVVWGNRNMRVLNLKTMAWVAHFEVEVEPESKNALRVAITPDGKQLFYCANPNTIGIGTIDSGESGVFATLPEDLTALELSPTGRHVVTATADKAIQCWDANTGQQQSHFSVSAQVRTVAFSGDETRIFTGCEDGHLRVYDVANGALQEDKALHDGAIMDIALADADELVVSLAFDGSVAGTEWSTGKQRFFLGLAQSYRMVMDGNVAIRLSKDNRYLLIHEAMGFRTTAVDLKDGSVVLGPVDGHRIELLQGGETVLRITQPGVVAVLRPQ